METSEQRNQRFKDLKENIANQLLEKYPNVTFNRHAYGIDVIHYVTYFADKIYVGKRTKAINNSIFQLNSFFLTENEAKQAINKHLPKAKQKFEKCLKSLNKLKEVLKFDVSYSIEGDTHGIEDHPYISFTMNGFDFTFTIDN